MRKRNPTSKILKIEKNYLGLGERAKRAPRTQSCQTVQQLAHAVVHPEHAKVHLERSEQLEL